MTVEDLQLSPVMHRRALELLVFCPRVVYLSGRRDLQEQAHAMATNVVTDRRFIFRTYRRAALLQTAVDTHPEATTVDELEEVLHATMLEMSPEERRQLSDHLSGDAVDMMPMEGPGQEEGAIVIDWIEKCPDTKWFTTREAGKRRWHWSCRASEEV